MTIESNTTVKLDSNANQEPLNDNESCNGNFIPSLTLLEWVWVNQNSPNTETIDFNPAQNGGKNFFSCNAATYDSSPK